MGWPVFVPFLAIATLVGALAAPDAPWVVWGAAPALIGAVIAAVHHAEVIAHRLGEPFGTLVLALAVTAIEVSLIVSVMVAGGEEKATLARDTVYATVMIICNRRHRPVRARGRDPPSRAVLPHRGHRPGARRARRRSRCSCS